MSEVEPIFTGEMADLEQCHRDIEVYNRALAEISTKNIALLGAKKALEDELERVKFNEEVNRRQYNDTQRALGNIDMMFCRLSKCLTEIKELVENSCWEEADNGIKKRILEKIEGVKNG